MAACTDPRARPVRPQIVIQYSPSLQVTSPGSLAHTVYVYDADGLDALDVSIASGDGTLSRDTTIVPFDLFQMNVSLSWPIPAGIPVGTPIRVIALVRDLAGFQAADTVDFAVQDSTLARRQGARKSLSLQGFPAIFPIREPAIGSRPVRGPSGGLPGGEIAPWPTGEGPGRGSAAGAAGALT